MRRPSRQGQSAVQSLYCAVTIAIPSFLLACLPTDRVHAQGSDAVDTYFEAIISGMPAQFPDVHPDTSSETLADFYKAITPRLQDTSVVVKVKACELIAFVASRVRNADARLKGVDLLTNACASGTFRLRSLAVDLLTKFKPADFSPLAKDTLRSLVRSEAPPLDRLFRLVGFVGLDDLNAVIRPYSNVGHPSHIRWSAIVALARLGDRSAVDGMMRRVKSIPVNDDVVYHLFPDLVYTRQRDAIAYLAEALQSDAKACRSADAERDIAISCGYRIMELLASVVEDFPFILDESGDLVTNDYPAALQKVRTWFIENNNYKIRKDTY